MTPEEVIDEWIDSEWNCGADVIRALEDEGYRIVGKGRCPGCGADEAHALEATACAECASCSHKWHHTNTI
jgi:hypothetical protein